mgnify:CR=1 FL=1
MSEAGRLRLDEMEQRVCDIASQQLAIPRERVSPGDRIIEDLNCDSLDLVELLMEVEDAFGITLPERAPNAVYKAVFTRQPQDRTGDVATIEARAATCDERPVHPTRRSLRGAGDTKNRSPGAPGARWCVDAVPQAVRRHAVCPHASGKRGGRERRRRRPPRRAAPPRR